MEVPFPIKSREKAFDPLVGRVGHGYEKEYEKEYEKKSEKKSEN
jgi:hypothetical protein